MTINTLILGAGYVGRRLADRLNAPATHRTKERCTAESTLCFDLADRTSWDRMPTAESVVWTFPAAPLSLVQMFYRAKLKTATRLIVYASTSCYRTGQADRWIDESQPLDLTRERVAGEEWLRKQGATILALAGIHGPNRHPRDWLAKGLITTPDKRVNLIHVEDIVAITERLLKDPRIPRGERFNLADGNPLLWRDIAAHYGIPIENSGKNYDSKRIGNDKIRDWLGGYRFRSLY